MNRQVRADMKDIVTTLYKRGELKSISECVADLDGGKGWSGWMEGMKWMDGLRLHKTALLSEKNRNRTARWGQDHLSLVSLRVGELYL